MIDLTKLTMEQANKLEMYLITCEEDIVDSITTYERLSEDPEFSDSIRAKFRSNSEWYKELYQLIFEKEYEEVWRNDYKRNKHE